MTAEEPNHAATPLSEVFPLPQSAGPYVSIDLRPTGVNELSNLLHVLSMYGLAPEGRLPGEEQSVWFKSGWDAALDEFKDRPVKAEDIDPGDWERAVAADTSLIAEAGTYAEPVTMPEIREAWQDRNPGQAEKTLSELERVRAQLAEERERLSAYFVQRAEILAARNRVEAERNAARAALADAHTRADEWRGKHDALADELDEARAAAVNLEKSVDAARADRDDMREALTVERDLANKMKAQRDEARKIAEKLNDVIGDPYPAGVYLPWRGAKPGWFGGLGPDAVDPCVAGTCDHAPDGGNHPVVPMVRPQ